MSICLDPSPEQQLILASVNRLLDAQFPAARLRSSAAGGDMPAQSVAALAGIGALGLGLSEEQGGAGFGLLEDVLLFVALGRHLITPSALATVMAARLATECGHKELAQSLLSGRQSVCLGQPLGAWQNDEQPLPVHVFDAAGADDVLLWGESGLGLASLADLTLEPRTPMDRSVSLHHTKVRFRSLKLWRSAGDTRLWLQAQLLLGAQLLGMAQACTDMAVAYAKLRSQFGRPIGSFQAVKHRCADMAVRSEVLRAQLHMATLAEVRQASDADFQIAACHWLAADHALANARSNVQIHGGIGFAAECDAHLYVLRAHLYDQIGGKVDGRRLLSHRWADPL